MGTKRSSTSLAGLGPLMLFVTVFTVGGVAPSLWGSWAGWAEVWSDPLFGESFLFSLRVAGISALVSTIVGFWLALAVHSWTGWQRVLAQVFRIPLILPHLSVAFVILLAFTPSGVVASLLHGVGVEGNQWISPVLYSGQGWGIVLASVVKEVPFLMVLNLASLAQLDARLVMTARNLGARRLQILGTVLLPHCFTSLQTGFLITFLYSFGAFEIPFLVGESHPSMVSIRVLSALFHGDAGEHPRARAFLLLIFAFCLLFLSLYLRATSRRVGRGRKR